MDIRELCNELLKQEMNARNIPTTDVTSYLASGAKALANNAPEVVAALTASAFNPYMALALLLKIAKDFGGEIAADRKLEKLIASPYKDGLEHLKIAGSANLEHIRQYELTKASERFLTASTVDRPLIAAKARFLAGVCYQLLGEKDTALDQYREAYEQGQQEIVKRLQKLTLTKKVVRNSGLLGAATIAVPHAISLAGPLALMGIGLYVTKGVLGGKTVEEFQRELATTLTQLKDKTLKLTDGVVDSLRATEIREIEDIQGNFLIPLSELLSRDETNLIQ